MLKKVLIGLGVVIVLVVLVGFLLPSSTRLERSIVINAPAEKIFNQLNTFTTSPAWSPWQKMDAEMTHVYSGPESGVGHKDTWTSDPGKLGPGTQEIIESTPNSRIVSHLTFSGEEGGNGVFELTPEGDGTKVVWAMETAPTGNPFVRYQGLMMKMFMGKVFEDGLKDLKTYIETLPEPEPEMEVIPEEGAQSDSLNAVTPEVEG